MNTDETINKEELTLQNTPKAVNYLINEIAEMRVLLEHIESQLGLGVDKHRPINIEKACQILNQTKMASIKWSEAEPYLIIYKETKFISLRTN